MDQTLLTARAVITTVWTTNIQIKFKCNIFIMLGYKTEVKCTIKYISIDIEMLKSTGWDYFDLNIKTGSVQFIVL